MVKKKSEKKNTQKIQDNHGTINQDVVNIFLSDRKQCHSTGYILTPKAPQWVNDAIICRDDFIDALSAELSDGYPHLQLTGMGGIGKTEVLNKLYAIYTAKPDMGNFDHIGLLFYSGAIDMDIEQQIDYPKQYKGLKGAQAAQQYLQDLCNENRVLLLVDDIREKQVIIAEGDPALICLRSLRASIVMASRMAMPRFLLRPVGVLSTDACIRIFESQLGKSVDTEKERSILADIIENEAGSNTLIVNRLGVMARDYGWSITELSAQLNARSFNIYKGIRDDELLQQEINKLYLVGDDFGTAEKSILEAFSAFPAIPLPQDICVDWLSEDAYVEPDRCRLLLSRLAEQTWLEKRYSTEGGTPFFSMHQMVTAAVQAQTNVNSSSHTALVERCASSLLQHTGKYEFNRASQLVPFATSVFEYYYDEDVATAKLASSIGKYQNYTASYTKALVWYMKGLAINEKVLGKEHPTTTTSYNNIAVMYHYLGDYSKALEWYWKALEIREEVLGKGHIATATTYNNIAGVYESLGDYSKALEWYEKALEIREMVLGKEHTSTATIYNNIAGAYESLGVYSKALEWYEKALKIRERVLGREHPTTASTYSNIAGVCYDQGEYPNALEWYEKALGIVEKVLGEEHTATATTYNNIAGVYFRQREYPKALEWYEKALGIVEKVLGKEHPYTASTYNNIAGVFDSQGEYPKALEWYEKALGIIVKVLGKEHPNTAAVYNNIGVLYTNQGDSAKALHWLNKALIIREKKLGIEHPYTVNTRELIVEIKKRMDSMQA